MQACVDSGMPVTHLDICDVMGPEHMTSATDDYLARVAELVAGMNLPVDRFIIGAVNEYGGGTNASWKADRIRLNQIVRDALPDHTIVEGPGNWKGAESLFRPNNKSGEFPATGGVGTYEPWEDTNTIQDVHHYYGWPLPEFNWSSQHPCDTGSR